MSSKAFFNSALEPRQFGPHNHSEILENFAVIEQNKNQPG